MNETTPQGTKESKVEALDRLSRQIEKMLKQNEYDRFCDKWDLHPANPTVRLLYE